jgi:probable phosphoglycerate mutase
MTEIIFVRHGETVWHAENRYAGISDIALTAKGLEQGKKLANWAETAQLSAIYSSELKRAKSTAEFSCQKTGLDLNVEKRLNEVNFGEGEGLTRDEMKQKFPEELAKFIEAPADNPLPDGEKGVNAIERANPVINEIIEKYPKGKVLIVAHSTLIRLLLCKFMNIDPNEYRTRFPEIENCALNSLNFESDQINVIELNHSTSNY